MSNSDEFHKESQVYNWSFLHHKYYFDSYVTHLCSITNLQLIVKFITGKYVSNMYFCGLQSKFTINKKIRLHQNQRFHTSTHLIDYINTVCIPNLIKHIMFFPLFVWTYLMSETLKLKLCTKAIQTW